MDSEIRILISRRRYEEPLETIASRRLWIRDLPAAPMPPLATTLERYLASIEAVVPKTAYENTVQIVTEFAQHDGPTLQKLVEKQAKKEHNWATAVWLPDMYLQNRLPLPINQSAFFLFPRQNFKTPRDQVAFAADLTKFALYFHHLIETEKLEQDFSSASHAQRSPMCMETYQNFFNSYRRPGAQSDYQLVKKDISQQCIVVINRKKFYRIDLDRNTSLVGLANALLQIRQSSLVPDVTPGTIPPAVNIPHVGALTTQNRAQWAPQYELLRKENTENIEALERSLMVLCLDETLPLALSGPTKVHQCENLLHGKGVAVNSCNRWYDKTLQVVVGADGTCGVIMEHSQSEGITLLRFMEMFIQKMSRVKNPENIEWKNELAIPVEPMEWELTPYLEQAIETAKENLEKAVKDVDLYVLHFKEFGKEFPKSQNISPDVFVQLALQLTYYKVHRKLVSTYESASLRRFYLGRADNIRAATCEVLSWVQAMCDDSGQHLTLQQKHDLFRKAVDKQTAILKYTISGMGPDNHLLALRETAKKIKLKCQLFEDSSYKEFLNFQLSTSQLPNDSQITVGYGAVVPDGYGCSYTICSNDMMFCVTSFLSSSATSSDFFALSLEGSLNQIRELCTTVDNSQPATPSPDPMPRKRSNVKT